jgi:hypothetical protein
MTRLDDFRQAATPLDRFLHASVGEDRNGNPVTVLSTFARLGLDPWEEATGLSKRAPESARLRLGGLLARVRDVAGAGSGTSVQRLLDLLPQKASAHPQRGGAPSAHSNGFGLGEILAIIALLLVMYSLFFGPGGSGG